MVHQALQSLEHWCLFDGLFWTKGHTCCPMNRRSTRFSNYWQKTSMYAPISYSLPPSNVLQVGPGSCINFVDGIRRPCSPRIQNASKSSHSTSHSIKGS